MNRRGTTSALRKIFHFVLIVVGAMVLTVAFFLVLPLLQEITKPPTADLLVHSVDTANIPPPPPPPEEQPEEQQEQEEKPPELMEEAPPLDLSQLELALDPGFSEGWMGGDFAVKLNTVVSGTKQVDELFTIADLDQKPRVIYQPNPIITAKLRKKAPGTVHIAFYVDRDGRVKSPKVLSSTDPAFERAALAAIKKWKFEPGKRKGQAVQFRMRVPITFPKG